MSRLLIYGYGYSGSLIAKETVARGLNPIIAGRNADKVRALAELLGLEARVVDLGCGPALRDALEDVAVVLHCAGPFVHTYAAMAEACLATGTHYLDITGEIPVFEALAAMSERAKEAGVLLMPGVGLDVVPSDCLLAHVAGRLPGATHLSMAFSAQGRASHGTLNTMVELSPSGGLVRQQGALVHVPAGWKTRVIDFGNGPRTTVTVPWGDVSTAFYTTGIGNIETYLALPAVLRCAMRLSRPFGRLIGSGPWQRAAKWWVKRQPAGPSDEERERGFVHFWAEASDDAGKRVVSRLRCNEGYTMTALTAARIAERVLAGEGPTGFSTPAGAFGADFVLQFDGIEREDLA